MAQDSSFSAICATAVDEVAGESIVCVEGFDRPDAQRPARTDVTT